MRQDACQTPNDLMRKFTCKAWRASWKRALKKKMDSDYISDPLKWRIWTGYQASTVRWKRFFKILNDSQSSTVLLCLAFLWALFLAWMPSFIWGVMKGLGLCVSLKVFMGVWSFKEAINRSMKTSSLSLIGSFVFTMSHDILDTSENISSSYV